MINVKEVCEIINLHEDIRKQVIEFDKDFILMSNSNFVFKQKSGR